MLLRTVRLLAQVTQQVAIVQYPTLSHSTVRHVELVALSSTRLLLILITSTGRIEQRAMGVPESRRRDGRPSCAPTSTPPRSASRPRRPRSG